jgi:hypothetical protein
MEQVIDLTKDFLLARVPKVQETKVRMDKWITSN